MALFVFDMGRRIETPPRPQHFRVTKVSESQSPDAIDQYSLTTDSNNQHAVQAYQQQQQREKAPQSVALVADIMQREVISIGTDANDRDAWLLLQQHNYRHLPVIDSDKRIHAIVSDRDLLNYQFEKRQFENHQFEKHQSQQHQFKQQAQPEQQTQSAQATSANTPVAILTIAQSPVVCASADTDIRQAARILLDYDIGALPVLDSQQALCGILTRSDILRLLSHYGPMELWA